MYRKTHLSTLFLFVYLLIYSVPSNAFSVGNNLRFEHLTIDEGLVQSDVTAIIQDRTGYLWMGTNNGLNLYDGYRFVRWKWDPKAVESTISSNPIISLSAGKDGKVWIATTTSLDAYDPDIAGFINYKQQLKEALSDNSGNFRINKVYCDDRGEVWLCYRNKLLWLNTNEQKFEVWTIKAQGVKPNYIQDMKMDKHRNLYLGSNRGIFVFNTQSKTFRYLFDRKAPKKYLRYQVNSMLIDPNGDILAGTSNGLWLLTPTGNIIKEIILDEHHGNNVITALLRDSQNQIWAGSRKNGLYLIRNNEIKQFKANDSENSSLSYNEVLSLYEDASGILWIGTATGGLNKLILQESPFVNIYHQPKAVNTLSDNLVHAIYTEDGETVWLGTQNGILNEWNTRTNCFIHYKLPSHITAINKKTSEELWIGTGEGLKVFNKKTKKVIPFRLENRINRSFTSVLYQDRGDTLWCGSGGGVCLIAPDGTASQLYVDNVAVKRNIRSIIQTKDGDVWIGTRDNGIMHIHRTSKGFQSINKEKGNSIYNDISYFFEDSEERLWIGTWGAGLYQIMDRDTLGYRNYSEMDGLSDNLIYSIYEDKNGQLWISTCNGLASFNPDTESFHKYTSYDGLSSNEFSKGAHFQDSQGIIYLAGLNGVTVFQPEEICTRSQSPQVAITGLQVYNTTIRPGKKYEGKVILPQAISSTDHITLKYDERHFTFSFVVFSYHAPQKNRFAYRLSGIDKEWVYTNEHSSASYSHLNPGTYLFEVKGCNSDGIWSEKIIRMTITILPPFWATPMAYFVYLIFITGLSIVIVLWIRRKSEMKRILMQEKVYEENQKALYHAKMKFYTNISHELRTPVTLIVGLAEKLEHNLQEEGEEKHTMLSIISKNAKMLLRLINDLLDFRKIETGNMHLNPLPQEIIPFVRTTCSFFEERAKERNLRLSFYSDDCNQLILMIDINTVQRIIYNLLSNAVKFAHSYIEVAVEKKTCNGQEWLLISVRNDGESIPEEEQEKIFSRFYQIDTGNHHTPGSGIGLNLCRELAHLHQGEIQLSSKPGEGATFTLYLPVVYPELPEPPSINELEEIRKEEKQLPILLIIDDNKDIRYYMHHLLSDEYEIMEASGGLQGWEMIQQYLPDIVISDVMMPDMDGIELCHRIKTSPNTCHIPVILVTAKLSDTSQIQALKCGADSYIVKPFTETHIKAQVTNILVSREKLKEQLLKELSNNIGQPTAVPLQDKLLQKIVNTIESNLDNSEYDIDRLSKDIGLSRMHLYRKLKGIIGQTPSDFIRDYKLARAAELLKRPDLNVAEVSDMTGFASPKMFRTYFKKKYNLTPSEYQKNYFINDKS